LVKQALWQVSLFAPFYIPRSKFDLPSANAVHQADFFFPQDKVLHDCKVFKYALTVVDVASCYKEEESLTSKESAEVAKAFQKIYKRRPLKWPNSFRALLPRK